jgi:DMSO/TMAO reductase YedYZ molybdopterin-dependent catalytic subunit
MLKEMVNMTNDPIISPDTQRQHRIPPNQVETRKWPILHAGPTPEYDLRDWDLTIFPVPLVSEIKRFSWEEFTRLPRVQVFADMHCVTRWSKLNNLWEGVATRELLNHFTVSEKARFVMIHAEHGFSTNLPIHEFFGDDCLLAMKHNGQDLDPDHGFPLRLVIPRLYAWKSAKWVRGIEFMEEDRPGFWESWENGGYHLLGDPWSEQRFRDEDFGESTGANL